MSGDLSPQLIIFSPALNNSPHTPIIPRPQSHAGSNFRQVLGVNPVLMVLPHTTSVIFRERVYRVSLSLYLPKTNSRCTEPFPAICISRSILPTTISAGPFKPGQDWVALDSCPSYLPTIQTTYLLHCPCNWNATMKG
jgi:hypothetical protein